MATQQAANHDNWRAFWQCRPGTEISALCLRAPVGSRAGHLHLRAFPFVTVPWPPRMRFYIHPAACKGCTVVSTVTQVSRKPTYGCDGGDEAGAQ